MHVNDPEAYDPDIEKVIKCDCYCGEDDGSHNNTGGGSPEGDGSS